MSYEHPDWLRAPQYMHGPEYYESILGVRWSEIVKMRAALNSETPLVADQARHILGLTADSKTVRAILGTAPDIGTDVKGGGAC